MSGRITAVVGLALMAVSAGGAWAAVPYGKHQDGSPCIWPGGVVPYVIDDNVPGRDRILRAIREWDTKTVLRFVERTSERDYLRFALEPVSGTYLCREDTPGEQIEAQRGPHGNSYEVILHGIGHAIGLAHEMQRRDRDHWVTVFSENISAKPYARDNWHPHIGSDVGIGPYDYRSIMTYDAFAHGKRRNHARTLAMETIPPGIPFGGEQLGDAAELSPGDIDAVARLYGHVPTEHVIATNPPGLEIIVDGERMTAPARFTWEIGSEHTLEMPSPQFRPGRRFLFGRWSDDGARAHTITATAATTLYYANFISQHQVPVSVNISCRRAACSPDDGSVTITPASPDGYYTLRAPIEIEASTVPGSAARFLRWTVHGDGYWKWSWTSRHGEASNPARTRVGPGTAYEAHFVDGPIFRIESNVDPVPITIGERWERPTPVAYRADRFQGAPVVSMFERTDFNGGYRHRFRSWSDGGDITHAIQVPQDADSTLTLTLDTLYLLSARPWQDWYGNRVETSPDPIGDGYYAEGTRVRLLAVARPPARFIGWNGAVSGRNPAAVVTMNDGQLAEAAFALDATELRSGMPAQVSLRWQGTDPEYHELDFEKYYVPMPSDASKLEIRFDTRSASPGAVAGLWVAGQDLWPGWVKSSETANRILGDGIAMISLRRPGDRWPPAYMILVRAAESNSAETQTLEGTLVATVTRDATGNQAPRAMRPLENRTLGAGGSALVIDVAGTFSDPDGDVLTYAAVSSSEIVARATAWGSTVTVAPVAAGSTVVTVTATDVDGSGRTAVQRFAVTVPNCRRFTDHPLLPGVTPIRAVHFLELRACVDALRAGAGLPALQWVDAVLTAGLTPIRPVHLVELRTALDAVYERNGHETPELHGQPHDAGDCNQSISRGGTARRGHIVPERSRSKGRSWALPSPA